MALICRRSVISALLLVTQLAVADDTPMHLQHWLADPAKSTISFTATQEGAEFTGVFHQFNVGLELVADSNTASLQSVATGIELGSVDTSYQDRDDYLAQEEWFHIAKWPRATFTSEQLIDKGDGAYTASGQLSLRGVSQPVEVALQLQIEDNRERGRLTGSATIQRLVFGIGQGEWTNTKWVGNEVNVEFDLYLLRAFE